METKFVIMGLPASGKTTFLAALWHLIESEETESKLRLDQYKGDLAYLNKIAEAWRTFKPVPRTSQVGDTDVVIKLIETETGKRGTAFFPDLAGETFDLQVEARRCTSSFIHNIAEDDGILFFVSADSKEDNLSILELEKRLPPDDEVQEEKAILSDQKSISSNPAPEWEPKHIPAQVRVVQILTDILRRPFTPRQRRLAILISAWDLTIGMELTPDLWLNRHMPLVWQFLKTNSKQFEHAVYGVSAQGVSLTDNAAVDEAAELVPSRRIKIVGTHGEAHDLTLPLVWLMSKRD